MGLGGEDRTVDDQRRPVLVDVLLDDGDLDAAWAAARGPIGQFPHRVESWH